MTHFLVICEWRFIRENAQLYLFVRNWDSDPFNYVAQILITRRAIMQINYDPNE